MFCGTILTSTSMLLMRSGGKTIDFSNGLWNAMLTGNLWFIGIFVGWISGLLFALVTTRLDISTAISFYIPLAYTITFIGGIVILKEPLSINKAIGCLCIIIGLCFILRQA